MDSNRYDIIVVGGGFAGFAAAVAAAKRHKRVLLIEQYNCLGGAAAFDLVNPFMPYWTVDGERKKLLLSRGLFSAVTERLQAACGLRADGMCFDTEILKYVLMKIALESGVRLLFDTVVTAVDRDGRKIRSVTVHNVAGAEELFADCFIDATGDANVAFAAGCKYTVGRESDGLCQPMTLCFRLGNVKTATDIGENRDGRAGEPCDVSAIDRLYKAFRQSGKLRNPREDVLMFKTPAEGVYHFNTTRVVKLDPTDAYDVTKAEIEAREQVFEMVGFLRENFEAFRDCVLLSTGIRIGARESRKIVGEHVLTAEELLACTVFDDAIAACNYDIDIHSPDGTGTHHKYFAAGTYYTIPYRSLVPVDTDNLLVAGRCVSATHSAQASLRIMPTCCTMGEAAGVAATVMIDDRTTARRADVGKIRKILADNGAKID